MQTVMISKPITKFWSKFQIQLLLQLYWRAGKVTKPLQGHCSKILIRPSLYAPLTFFVTICCTIIKIQVSWISPGNIVCRETWQASQLPPLEHGGARKISKLLKKELVEHYSLISWSWGGFTLLARGARWP